MASLPVATNDTQIVPQSEEGRFALRQRQARMFAMSPLVPEHLRKGTPEQAMANCYIALTLAEAMGEVPLIVMQNIHVVHGTAGFKSEYKIARANNSGIFRGRIDWRVDRTDPQNLSVEAYALLKDTGQEVSFTCDMAMAKAEGWTSNKKYQTMPEVMLRYRSASFLIRFYAGDVMLGYQSIEEIEDIVASGAPTSEPLTAKMLTDQAAGEQEIEEQSAGEETVDEVTGEVIGEERAAAGTELFTAEEVPLAVITANRIQKLANDAPDKPAMHECIAEWGKHAKGIEAHDAELAAATYRAVEMGKQRVGIE